MATLGCRRRICAFRREYLPLSNRSALRPCSRPALLIPPGLSQPRLSSSQGLQRPQHISTETQPTTGRRPARRKIAWIITAGRVGKDKQAAALAARMGCEVEWKNVIPAPAIKWLFPAFQKRLLDYRQETYGPHSDRRDLPWFLFSPTHHTLAPPYPSVVLSTCAETTLAALHTKVSSLGRTRAVCVGMPFVSLEEFDAAVVARWEWPALALQKDAKVGGRVVPVELCLNSVGKGVLGAGSTAGEGIPECFRAQDGMVLAVLIGGGQERDFGWHNDDVTKLIKMLQRVLDVHQAKVLLTFSQRTTPFTREMITAWHDRQPDATKSRIHIYKEEPRGASTHNIEPLNPYEAFLDLATHIAVTADSLTMVSEALSVRKPTYIISLATLTSRPKQAVYAKLLEQRRIRRFVPSRYPAIDVHDRKFDILSDVGEHPPWSLEETADETDAVAEKVSELIWGAEKVAEESKEDSLRVDRELA
ncbi:mitochondrial fission ELM1-domain-containing protein [Fimicolochytrium jonesii]|uniref:mitochondrial fission ELM1-domain-containing protein n=1 Tax=Fimicolochytrium jonesii TaxID=1396493 RepID=UPI0022FE0E50|nr:mitochondrial fission ELM1-domain-containing protein [Fimicolochytrium jonesii]KAI8826892.1 mitochondrial fission ELM1-domain-containing protein [Fimicolochytrium jonesii]